LGPIATVAIAVAAVAVAREIARTAIHYPAPIAVPGFNNAQCIEHAGRLFVGVGEDPCAVAELRAVPGLPTARLEPGHAMRSVGAGRAAWRIGDLDAKSALGAGGRLSDFGDDAGADVAGVGAERVFWVGAAFPVVGCPLAARHGPHALGVGERVGDTRPEARSGTLLAQGHTAGADAGVNWGQTVAFIRQARTVARTGRTR